MPVKHANYADPYGFPFLLGSEAVISGGMLIKIVY